MTTLTFPPSVEPPIVEDAALRVALIAWFRMHAESWKRQADGCLAWGADSARVDSYRARAAACEQFSNELEQAVKGRRG